MAVRCEKKWTYEKIGTLRALNFLYSLLPSQYKAEIYSCFLFTLQSRMVYANFCSNILNVHQIWTLNELDIVELAEKNDPGILCNAKWINQLLTILKFCGINLR